MGYDLLRHAVVSEARVSRHNDERDAEDDASWEEYQREIDAATEKLQHDPRFARIFENDQPEGETT